MFIRCVRIDRTGVNDGAAGLEMWFGCFTQIEHGVYIGFKGVIKFFAGYFLQRFMLHLVSALLTKNIYLAKFLQSAVDDGLACCHYLCLREQHWLSSGFF